MRVRSLLPYILFLFAVPLFSPAQTVTVSNYTRSDYRRASLFLEQDKIYGQIFSFSPGLEVICRQDKVKIEISGLGTYFTPVSLDNIPPGDYRLSLKKTGYYPAEIKVTIIPGKRCSVIADLKPLTAELILDGLPENRTVFINNQETSGNRVTVPLGEISLRIEAFGYENYSTVLNLDSPEETEFRPQLKEKAFTLLDLKPTRNNIWLNDSPYLKKTIFTLISTAPASAHYTFTRLSDLSVREQGDIAVSSTRTFIPFDSSNPDFAVPGRYRLSIEATDGDRSYTLSSEVTVHRGGRAQWRNVFASSGGFLYCPDSRTLPAGLTQIQTGITAGITPGNINDLSIPAFLSFRSALNDRVEIAGGTGLYLSPEITESSLDIFISGKFSLLPSDRSDVFSLSAQAAINYNGRTSSFSEISPADPYAGISGFSLTLNGGVKYREFSLVLSPEIRIAPSYPFTEPGGFLTGKLNIWNYLRSAVVWDKGVFSAALSLALQTPSWLESNGQWPFYSGLDLNLTPGKTGFSLSCYCGLRYCSGDPLRINAGLSTGFMF